MVTSADADSEARFMSRGRQSFKQTDMTRALKAAKAAGIEIARIRIGKDGEIEIDAGKPKELAGEVGGNEWDTA